MILNNTFVVAINTQDIKLCLAQTDSDTPDLDERILTVIEGYCKDREKSLQHTLATYPEDTTIYHLFFVVYKYIEDTLPRIVKVKKVEYRTNQIVIQAEK